MSNLMKTGISFALCAMISAGPVFAQELMIADVVAQAISAGTCPGTSTPTNATYMPDGGVGVTCSPPGTPVQAGAVGGAPATGFVPALGAAGAAAGVAAGLTLVALVAGGGNDGTTGSTGSTSGTGG